MRLVMICAVSAAALSGQAAAETYNATGLEIANAAAVVTVIPENRSTIDIEIGPAGRLPTPTVRMTAEGVVIDGGLRHRLRGCSSWTGSSDQIRVSGIGNVRREDLPRIVVRVPRTLDYEAGGAVYSTIGASNGGVAEFNGCGDATMGDASGDLDVELNGSGSVRVQRAGGVLAAVVNGSGALRVDRAGANAALRLNGSGDLEVGDVTGRVDAQVSGSGGIEIGAAEGDARLVLNGSGNLRAGAIAGSLNAGVNGSGSIRVASVTGENATLELSGSGNLNVQGGRVNLLSASNSASGNVRFAGVAATTRASLSGSGNITIADAGRVERLIDSGSGSVTVGR